MPTPHKKKPIDPLLMKQEKERANVPNAIPTDAGFEPDYDERLLSLYISEYGMLTTRCTYWMTIHYGLLPLVALLITVVAQLWSSSEDKILWVLGLAVPVHTLLVWGCVTTVHIVTMLWSFVLTEYYRAVEYLEVRLRPLVKKLLRNGGTFWQYEQYLADTRKRSAFQWEYPIPGLMVVIIALAVLARVPICDIYEGKASYFSSVGDICGFIINLPLLVFLVHQARTAATIRQRFQEKIATKEVPSVS